MILQVYFVGKIVNVQTCLSIHLAYHPQYRGGLVKWIPKARQLDSSLQVNRHTPICLRNNFTKHNLVVLRSCGSTMPSPDAVLAFLTQVNEQDYVIVTGMSFFHNPALSLSKQRVGACLQGKG